MSHPALTLGIKCSESLISHTSTQVPEHVHQPSLSNVRPDQISNTVTKVEDTTNTSHASAFQTPSASISPAIDRAILAVADHTKRHPVAPPYYSNATAAAAATTVSDNSIGDCNFQLAAWLRDPYAPTTLTNGVVGHSLEVVAEFATNFDIDVNHILDEGMGNDVRQTLYWDRDHCEAETRYALGGATD